MNNSQRDSQRGTFKKKFSGDRSDTDSDSGSDEDDQAHEL